MRRLIVAGHGYFPKGLLNALEIIMGNQENAAILCAYTEETNIEKQIENLIFKYQNDEIIILTDLLGGSVNNFFLKYIDRENIHLVAGVNLALLIEIVCKLESIEDIPSFLKETIEQTKKSIIYCDKHYLEKEEKLSEF